MALPHNDWYDTDAARRSLARSLADTNEGTPLPHSVLRRRQLAAWCWRVVWLLGGAALLWRLAT